MDSSLDFPADVKAFRLRLAELDIPEKRRGKSKRLRRIAVVAAALSLTAGTALAAQQAGPGSPFYGLRKAAERAGILPVSDKLATQALRHLDIAEKLAEEAQQAMAEGRDVVASARAKAARMQVDLALELSDQLSQSDQPVIEARADSILAMLDGIADSPKDSVPGQEVEHPQPGGAQDPNGAPPDEPGPKGKGKP